MDQPTIDVYDDPRGVWAERRRPVRRADARAFARGRLTGMHRGSTSAAVPAGTRPTSGPRWWASTQSRAMLARCRRADRRALLVQGDLEALPFGRQCLHGGWANMSYLHVPRVRLPRPWPICTGSSWSAPPSRSRCWRATTRVSACPPIASAAGSSRRGHRVRSRRPRRSGLRRQRVERRRRLRTGSGDACPARCPTSWARACVCSWSVSTRASTRPTSASASPAPAIASGPRHWRAGLVTRDRDPLTRCASTAWG